MEQDHSMDDKIITISGKTEGVRLDSRILEERIQEAIAHGYRRLTVQAYGQHGIGGRLWKAGNDPVYMNVTGQSGQRLGSLGFPNTVIEVNGPASDDVGWLNAGARIIVHGHAGNGACNAMAQGKVFVGGNIGSRGMTMTKQNPRFAPPELWVLGSVGDYFGEFMAGGIAVICGVNPQDSENVLGYRPLVGMVGGKVFFRGPHRGFSQADAKLAPIELADWEWLTSHLKQFLDTLGRTELYPELIQAESWQLIVARTPKEKTARQRRSMASFHADVWDRELGKGGLIGDLVTFDRSPIPLVPTGELRRHVPVWENRKYKAPCEAQCPTGIPVHDRWRLVREGRVDEAVNLALNFTPFPATVCGYLCPNPCMQSCTRQAGGMASVDITQLGKASIAASLPELPQVSGQTIGIIGAGPAGLSVAWQLRLKGHAVTVYDTAASIGGKIASVIPGSRIPENVVTAELERIRKAIPHVHLQQRLEKTDFEKLRDDFDYLVIAVGAQKPRTLPVPGKERAITAMDFLKQAKTGTLSPGKRVVIIGAGNVGCDAATEAKRLGAADILLIDVQEPASFGKERRDAEVAGAVFRWPCFTREITAEGVVLTTGDILPADTVVISIGDAPDLDFLPDDILTDRGFIQVNDHGQTADPAIFAIGDAVKPGLLTDAIGSGRKAATALLNIIAGQPLESDQRPVIDTRRVSLEYFDPRITAFEDVDHCGSQCSSCGACRDCGICTTVCPQAAIRRLDIIPSGYEYRVDENRCIGCGFCVGACPCGVWNLVENQPLE
jgi:NADPH-dependent glutamate synthase beta subunit-like oxidoreductase/glutamate synthase domain-containing protein 3/NAD-dependent dihydropyrimidine dehydrogenase PreA subunit